MTKNTKTMLGVSAALLVLLALIAYLRHLERIAPKVVAGSIYTCQILRGGGAECWGGNIDGQLGKGVQSLSAPLVAAVSGLPSAAEAIALGETHTCAIVRNGAVWCWGANDGGQLGNGTQQRSFTPVNTGVTGAVQIVAGEAYSCAVVSGGALRCWGDNNGVFGDGTTIGSMTPSAPRLSGIRRIVSGGGYVCALLSGPDVNCWGVGLFNGLSLASSMTPMPVPGTAGAVDVAASNSNVCALWPDGRVKCWGDNTVGQLGDGSLVASSMTPVVPYLIEPGSAANNTPAKAISVGRGTACAVLVNGGVKCWGANQFGALGFGNTVGLDSCVGAGGIVSCSRRPVPLPGIALAVDVSSGRNHSCVVLNDDRVKCWGLNNFGQVGNGAVGSFADDSPQAAAPVFVARRSLAVGGGSTAFSCALSPNGTIKCWGDNTRGQLGAGVSTAQSTSPLAVSGIADGFAVFAGADFACARVVGPSPGVGFMRCWGANGSGQLGVGTTTGPQTCGSGANASACSNAPFGNSSVPDINTVGLGDAAGCAVRSDIGGGGTGNLRCWGLNSSGQLGVAATGMPLCGPTAQPCSASAVSAPDIEPALLSGGRAHMCTVDKRARVLCWGANNEGQLGRAGAGGPQPDFVPGISGAVAVASGSAHTCALVGGGVVTCWGRNRFGQLGDGSTQGSEAPVAVQGMQTAVAIAASAESSCALLRDGSVRCWGDDGSGQLGLGSQSAPDICQGALGTVTDRPCALAPVAVQGISTAVAIELGDQHACVVLYDGRVQCWGGNVRGELGRATAGSGSARAGDVLGL